MAAKLARSGNIRENQHSDYSPRAIRQKKHYVPSDLTVPRCRANRYKDVLERAIQVCEQGDMAGDVSQLHRQVRAVVAELLTIPPLPCYREETATRGKSDGTRTNKYGGIVFVLRLFALLRPGETLKVSEAKRIHKASGVSGERRCITVHFYRLHKKGAIRLAAEVSRDRPYQAQPGLQVLYTVVCAASSVERALKSSRTDVKDVDVKQSAAACTHFLVEALTILVGGFQNGGDAASPAIA